MPIFLDSILFTDLFFIFMPICYANVRPLGCQYFLFSGSTPEITSTETSAIFKKHDFTKWPKPPCKMYQPPEPFYDVDCPDVIAPVCASNGRTFQNECYFCVEQWEFGFHIEFEKYGKCD
uniref:serine protease inhibitor Kazal-type 13 isoform X1 n=1 Tax=Macaca mulatta TaxID=9544 RepID=UPI000760094B|nr:serine protease inhibitor Kazal-type 13 isoform X1 [Macaca mulatta]